MRCEVRSGVLMLGGDGCSDAAIFSWVLLGLIVARFACLCGWVRVILFGAFFVVCFKRLLCNAVSDLGRVPEGWEERERGGKRGGGGLVWVWGGGGGGGGL